MGKAFGALLAGMIEGREWGQMGDPEPVRQLLWNVYEERYHKAEHHKSRYQVRVNLQKKDDSAAYAGFITAENPTSGPYQGTSFVWMPGREGSIAVLVIGTDGFGADTHILGRPGHAHRLRALARLHKGKVRVKPELLDLSSRVPEPSIEQLRVDFRGRGILKSRLMQHREHLGPLLGGQGSRWTAAARQLLLRTGPTVEGGSRQAQHVAHRRHAQLANGIQGHAHQGSSSGLGNSTPRISDTFFGGPAGPRLV